jgi:Uma2 family endonuclease
MDDFAARGAHAFEPWAPMGGSLVYLRQRPPEARRRPSMTTSYQFTVADLERMPDDGSRYEVIDGELYVTAAPHFRHQAVLFQISAAFGVWFNATGGRGRGLPLPGAGVKFAFNAGVIPDFLWISNDRLRAITVNPATGERDGKFHEAPELLVEILSPGPENEERDRETKLTLYSRRGAKEYWIVDQARRAVEVYRRTPAAALELAATLGEGDTLTSPLLADFALPVAQIFVMPPELEGLGD